VNLKRMSEEIASLRDKVIRLYEQGRPAEAVADAVQVVNWTKSHYGESHPELAKSLNILALTYSALGQYKAAAPLLQHALEIRRKAYGEKHPAVATSLSNLAALYYDMGDFTSAESCYLQALGIERTAQTIHNLAALYHAMGNFAAAKRLFIEAQKIRRDTVGEEHADYAQTINCLGSLYFSIGNYAQAESLFFRALKIRRRLLGPKHPDYARTLNNLGALYYTVGEFARSERLYRRALRIRRQAFGTMMHPECAQSLDNLASLYRAQGLFAKALSGYKKALAVRRRLLGSDHPDVAVTLNNLAALHDDTGNFPEAERLYCQALAIRGRTLGERHPHYAQSLYNLARIYAATSRAKGAFGLMRQASAIDDQMISQVFSVASERQRIAYILDMAGRLDGFLSLVARHMPTSGEAVRAALDLVLRRKAILAEALAIQRDAVWLGRHPELQGKIETLAKLRQQIARETLEGPDGETIETHLLSLAELTVEKEKLEIELAQEIPDIALEQRLRAADRQAVALALPQDSALMEFVRYDVCDFQAIPSRGQPRWKDPRYLAFVLPAGKPDQVTLADIGKADEIDSLIRTFREMTARIETARGMPTGRECPDHKRPPSRDPAEELWQRLFQESLSPALDGCKRLFIAPDGELALLPFEALLTNDGRRLIEDYSISYLDCGRDVLRFGPAPHAPHANALVAADPNFDLAVTGERTSPAGKSNQLRCNLAESNLQFGRLSGSADEGRVIAGLLRVEPWLGDSVLDSSLKNCHSPRILHLATHGFFLPTLKPDVGQVEERADGTQPGGDGRWRPILRRIKAGPSASETTHQTDRLGRRTGPGWENPLVRSGLAVAGAETWRKGGSLPAPAEDGILTAEDVTGLDLLGTELVVLSACDTGVGEVQNGEGVFGLRRAFLLAGAKTLVMTLWKVDDKVTVELMENYYRQLLRGEGRASALHQAQLDLRQRYPDPFFWAAFICQGDPSPLPLDGSA
jgi:CHAT domain-containing protein/tetratricopeptide (TPR) repeat protein